MYPSKEWERIWANIPVGYVGNVRHGDDGPLFFTNHCNTTTGPVSVEAIAELMREFRRKQGEIDAGLVRAIRETAAQAGMGVLHFGIRHGLIGRITHEEYLGMMDGTVPVDQRLWDAVERAFGHLREKTA